jgi:hypothetical protein
LALHLPPSGGTSGCGVPDLDWDAQATTIVAAGISRRKNCARRACTAAFPVNIREPM